MTNPADPTNEQTPTGPAPQYQPPQYAPPQYQPPQYAPPQPQYAPPQHYSAAPQPPQYVSLPLPGPAGPFNGAVDPDDLSRPLYGATFGQAVRRFFKNYAGFSGRASRSEYWWVALFSVLVILVPSALFLIGLFGMGVSGVFSEYGYDDDGYDYSPGLGAAGVGAVILFGLGIVLLAIIALGMLVPSIALSWRRLHDANLPGPLYFISFVSIIPYVGWLADITMIVLALLPPKVGGRRFDR